MFAVDRHPLRVCGDRGAHAWRWNDVVTVVLPLSALCGFDPKNLLEVSD